MSEVTKVPVKAKRPQDKKPKKSKAEAPVVEELEGAKKVTYKGIEVTIEDEAIGDHRLLRAILRSESKSVGEEERIRASFETFDRLFGDDAERILTALEGPTGRVKMTDSLAFVSEVFQAIAPNS